MSNSAADLFDDGSDDNRYSDEEAVQSRKKHLSRRSRYSDDEVDDEGEEEEEEGDYDGGGGGARGRQRDLDEEDEEDDEEEEYRSNKRSAKTSKARRKRPRHHNFLDIEASVDTDEEEEDEDDGALNDFIVDNEAELASAEKDALRHRSAMRPAVFQDDETLDADAIEAQLRERYSGYARAGRGRTGAGVAQSDADWIPQRLLIPGISDPHLWMAKCVPGKERDIVFGAARRVFQWTSKGSFPGVHSVFSRDGLSGYIYVEARSLADAQAALEGIVGVFSHNMTLVPIDDMVDVVRIRKQEARLNPGAWVRIRRGNYAGDLAQVVAVIEASESVEVRMLPRIDYSAEGRTSKGSRPAQRLFNGDEARRFDPRGVNARNNEILWRGDRFIGGYLYKDVRITSLQTNDVSPTLDEIARFAAGDAGENGDEQAAIAALASQAAAASINAPKTTGSDLQPGEVVEVIEGDLAGVVGTIRSIDVDGTIRVVPELGGLRRGALMGFPAAQLRKRFRTGDHVQVLAGRHRGATGMVLSVADAVVTLYTDVAKEEIRVLAKDIRISSEISSAAAEGQNNRIGMDVHDLVFLDGNKTALVMTSSRDTLTVLDDRGELRKLPPSAVRPARASFERSGVDFSGNAIKRGDHVREVSGQGRSGSVLQVTRYVTFVMPRDGSSDAVFAVRTRQLESLSAQSANALDPYATRVNRTAAGRGGGARNGRGGGASPARGGRIGALRGGRDPLVGKTVAITRGEYKGYIGMCKDATATSARVELHTNAKIINIGKDKLSVRLPSGESVPALDFGSAGGRMNSAPSSAASGWNSSSSAPARTGYSSGSRSYNTPAAAAAAASPSGGYGGWDAAGSGGSGAASGGWDVTSPAPANGSNSYSSSNGASSGGGWNAGPSAPSGGWDHGSGATAAAAAAATPAATGWDMSGAGSVTNWNTPAPLTPGALPQTPGNTYGDTPGYYGASTPGGDRSTLSSDDSGFFSWAVPRAVVVLGSGQRGTVSSVSHDREHVTVALDHGGSETIDRSSVARLNPRPARAEKRDRVIVIRGSRRGALGTMVGRDGSEALFQPDGDSSWHPEPLRNLAVYSESRY
ncbi:transcription elongation factor spt5 [Coemansia asiatica]|uniref:Transcription elongation factor SPT5 n=1 Tax=Coemansia asiatica TaxID=1052880 RepID=A0A9W7XM18_9FUNG|nr:transcription elongation factor spt5 [Coemansia asiatica]